MLKKIRFERRAIELLLIIITLFIFFIIYCSYPIITFKENLDKSPGRILLYDRKGILITDKVNENGYKEEDIDYNIDSEIIKSIIKIEDKNYFDHYGVSIISKLRALKNNLINGKIVSGGSTITEQYIKNKYFKIQKRTVLQKFREAFLSLYFTTKEKKEFILNKYLNNIYFGNNIYGLKGAINIYFNKNYIEELTHEEITIIISLLHNPGIKNLEEKKYRKYFDKIKDKLGFKFERTIFSLNKKENINKFPFVTNIYNTQSSTKDMGLGVKLYIDSELQEFSREILNKTLNELASKNVTNGAIFAVIPKTGEVLIYQGSRDFNSKEIDGQVDIIKSRRQPGSTMKPFLYLLALESGANPDDLIVDLESEYNSFKEGKTYISTNYSLKEFGLVRLKKALGNSLNNATVRLARELGLQEVYNYYKKYGFKLDHHPEYYGYSLVLGNPSITLEDLVWSYVKLIPYNKNKFLLYDILSDPDNRDLSFGVNSILNTSIYQAVKTGTSSDFRDNLIVSYHPDLVLGIWIGNNDNSSMIGVTGITGAGYIWHHIIEKAIKLGYIKNRVIEIPEAIIQGNYCLDIECFRKELVYKKKGKEYFSNLSEKKYSNKDLFIKLNNSEKNRLKDFGIHLE